METKSTKTPTDKYIEVTYITGIEKPCMRLRFNATQPESTEEGADNYIAKVHAIEPLVEAENDKRGSICKPELIMLTYLPMINSIASGIDVRSKKSNQEIAEVIVDSYYNRYNNAINFCKQIMEMYDAGARKEGYGKHWRDYDKYNELIEEYQLEQFNKLTMDSFEINLSSLAKKADALLQALIEKNENKQ